MITVKGPSRFKKHPNREHPKNTEFPSNKNGYDFAIEQ